MHIRAKPGDVAELAVIMGDPARVEQAAALLDDARIINSYRGYLAYTGRYEGTPVTVACHCIGGPSAAIAVEAAGEGEVVVPGEAFHVSTLPMMYSGVAGPSIADPGLTERLAREVEATGLRVHRGSVFSSDAFYLEGPEIVERWRSAGAVAVEMECATVFAVAAARGISAAAALIVSNNLATHSRILTSEELKPITLRTVRAAINAMTS